MLLNFFGVLVFCIRIWYLAYPTHRSKVKKTTLPRFYPDFVQFFSKTPLNQMLSRLYPLYKIEIKAHGRALQNFVIHMMIS